MNRINEIYRNVLQETDKIRIRWELIERKIDAILVSEKEKMGMVEYEEFRDQYYQIAYQAEESGFVLGFQYAVQLMHECMKDGLL